MPDRLGTEMLMAKRPLDDDFSFDCWDIYPSQEHIEFGLDLMSPRMLRLLYEIVFFGRPTTERD